MLRRLRVWFARFLTGQGEHERLSRLLALLRANGVTRYEADGLVLRLAPPVPAAEKSALPPQRELSDQELLFGEPEEQLRRQGLLG